MAGRIPGGDKVTVAGERDRGEIECGDVGGDAARERGDGCHVWRDAQAQRLLEISITSLGAFKSVRTDDEAAVECSARFDTSIGR
jgi:hypothetical protein